MGFIQSIINYILWLPCTWILQLLNGINDVINYLASDLLETILFGGKVSDWSMVLIPATYYRILIVAGVCWFLLLVGTFINHLRKDILEYEETPVTKKIWEALKYSTFSAILLIFIPLFVWLLTKITSVINEGLMLAFGAKNASIADLLYNLGNPSWDGQINDMNGNYPSPGNLAEWNMIVELLGLCIVFLCLLLVMINIVVNIFTTFFYFIMTAFYALTSVFDQGERMKDYAKTMIANNLVICSSMLIFSVYASLIMISFKATSTLNMADFTKMLLQLVLAVGGGLFVVKGDQYVSRLVGENISGTSDAMSGLEMVKGGMMMAGGLAALAGKGMKRGLVGKAFGGAKGLDKIGSKASRMFSQDGLQDSQQGESGSMNLDPNQEAKANFVQSRQQAMQRYQKSGSFNAFSLAGMGAAATMNTAKTAKNAIGSIIGTKASRMMARQQLKEQGASLKAGFGDIGKTIFRGTGAAVGATIGLTGINKIVSRNRKELGNTYTSGINKKINNATEAKINKINNKFEPKIRKYEDEANSNIFDIPSYVKTDIIKTKKDKKITRLNAKAGKFQKKYDKKTEKYKQYAKKNNDK